MGQAAYATALAVDRFHQRLHIAASDLAPRKDRAEAAIAVMVQWPIICRQYALFQESAPNLAREAADRYGRLQDYKEING
jgi:hypothetical protein